MTGTGLLKKHFFFPTAFLLAGFTLVLGLIFIPSPSVSANLALGPMPDSKPDLLSQEADETCFECHGQPGQTVQLPSGDILPLTINPEQYEVSVHGSRDITCVTCHTGYTEYPHPELAAQNQRQVAIQMSSTCAKCHEDKAELIADSVHHQVLEAGNENAAVCSDCHNPHTQPQIMDSQTQQINPLARVEIPKTCAQCHNAIYDDYQNSVHGSALIGEGNLDVPSCADCHGSHQMDDPTTVAFRLSSPQMCGECHTDPVKMPKYGLSTDVLSTYVSDFHGTTVALFQKIEPNQPTNTPVCYDCHGVHNIARVDDPERGLEVKENLLVACQRCHPDATVNFPDSWMSHYIASPTRHPLVFFVDLFYIILIPTILGGMVLFVASDAFRRIKDRRKGAMHS